MNEKTCFVVMPIRKLGTDEYLHFRAIYNQIKPTIEGEGYAVLRGDDVQKSGAITKDIVSRLAESDLVVADLTDLNPNVFYELGVRHALRGRGTIMIIDEKRTTDIPFDLSAYRVIKFSGDLTGIETLNTALASFLQESADSDTSRDNPVHDWFPMLPVNVLEVAAQSSEAPLRRTIKELQERIDQYEKAYGSALPSRSREDSPLSLILSTVSDAEDGVLPVNVLSGARKAFDDRDVVAFLKSVRIAIERNVPLSATAFLTLVKYASVFDLDRVVEALFQQALQFYPSEGNLKRTYLAHLAHSESPAVRARARVDIASEVGLEVSSTDVTVKDLARLEQELALTGMLLDAYHRDNLDEDALRITEKLAELFPDRTQVLRARARGLMRVGKTKEAMSVYRAAIFAPDVDDTSAVWLGNELHNQHKNLAAAEAYAYGCLLDPSDAKIFAHLAEEIAFSVSGAGAKVGTTGTLRHRRCCTRERNESTR